MATRCLHVIVARAAVGVFRIQLCRVPHSAVHMGAIPLHRQRSFSGASTPSDKKKEKTELVLQSIELHKR